MSDHYAPSPQTQSSESGFYLDAAHEASGIVHAAETGFDAQWSVPTMIAQGSFVIKGLKVVEHASGYHHVAKYVGETNVPHDIARMRRYVYELMRRMGTPVLYKKMLTEDDVISGYAEESPNFNAVYGQTRNRDPLSHGIGFVSKEKSDYEWIDPQTSDIFESETDPGGSFVQAPKYRGYGPGLLLFIIEPDAAVDFFKHTPEGVFMKVQTATAQAPWWPDINDNDLLIHVELDRSGYIVDTMERYQAQMANPISIRGAKERRGKQEYSGDFGSRYVINTTFQMALLPGTHEANHVEVDR